MNSTRARVLRGLDHAGATSQVELVLKSEARNLRQIMSDRQGISFGFSPPGLRPGTDSRRASSSGAPSVGTLVDEDRREFIGQVAALLESHRSAGDFDQLAVFAEPEVLGMLRQILPDALRATVVCEVPKNLVHLSERDLPKVILKAVGTGPQPL